MTTEGDAPTPPVVLIGGIHGAGKTYLGSQLAQKLDARHLVGSDLLVTDTEGKAVENVNRNQTEILESLRRALASDDRPVILDGHFTITSPDGSIQEIPLEYFDQLSPSALLVVSTPIRTVQSRLEHRDRRIHSTAFTQQFSRAELAHARRVSDHLGVPLCILNNSNEVDSAVRFLANILNQHS